MMRSLRMDSMPSAGLSAIRDGILTVSVFLVLMTLLAPRTVMGEEPATRLDECAGIADNAERLRCYDAIPAARHDPGEPAVREGKERKPSSNAGGAYLTETVFAWPGIGRLSVEALFRRDYALVQGTTLMVVFFFIIVNLVVDLLYSILDPRISYH